MDRAVEVLELMTSAKVRYPFDNFVCSSVIAGFCKIGKPELALGFFKNAINSGTLRPNLVAYTALLSTFDMLGRFNEACGLVSSMEKKGWLWMFLFIAVGFVVRWRGKGGWIFEKMLQDGVMPNVVTYSAIMLGFSEEGKLEEAFTLFKEVEDMGIEVDEFKYATLIDGACTKGDFDCVFHLLDEMETKGIKPSIVTYNKLINGFCKAGRTSEADNVFKQVDGDIATCSSTLLHGYAQEGNVKGIFKKKRKLEESGLCMDVVACNILIKALFMVGAFEDAHALYQAIPEMDLTADSITYCAMIDGYCKAGRI
ncbi:hypothetical protein REPUB_Repub11eG0074300 [Reevesia pubescens]